MQLKIENLLTDLIKFKTIEKNKDELRKVIQYCYDYLKQNDLLRIEVFEVNQKWNLIAKFSKEVLVYFVAHLDVVDGLDEQFEPILKEGKIIGRGSLDMKGPSSVLIELFKNLNDRDYPVGLILTTDEEVGSQNGVKYIVENKNVHSKLVIIPDGGENFRIITKGKGAFHFRVKSKGKSAHGSTPWAGVNSIEKIIMFYQTLKEAIIFKENLDDSNHWYNTINIGKIEGGQKVNIVPDFAQADIDIRFTEKYTLNEIQNLVSYLAKKFDLDLEILSTGNPVIVDTDSVYFRKFLESYRRVIGDVVFDVEHGATDGRFFASLGIPVITLYPVGGGIHSEYEWVEIDSLYKMYELFYDYVKNL